MSEEESDFNEGDQSEEVEDENSMGPLKKAPTQTGGQKPIQLRPSEIKSQTKRKEENKSRSVSKIASVMSKQATLRS